MFTKWTKIFLVPGGGNFENLAKAKRAAQDDANARGIEVRVYSAKMEGNYPRGASELKATIKPHKSNPDKTSQFDVTIRVPARSAKEAREIVERSTGERENPYGWITLPKLSAKKTARLIAYLELRGIGWTRTGNGIISFDGDAQPLHTDSIVKSNAKEAREIVARSNPSDYERALERERLARIAKGRPPMTYADKELLQRAYSPMERERLDFNRRVYESAARSTGERSNPYRVLLQKGKVALGVLPITFQSSSAVDDYMDARYPGHFYATDFADSPRVRIWLKKFSTYKGHDDA